MIYNVYLQLVSSQSVKKKAKTEITENNINHLASRLVFSATSQFPSCYLHFAWQHLSLIFIYYCYCLFLPVFNPVCVALLLLLLRCLWCLAQYTVRFVHQAEMQLIRAPRQVVFTSLSQSPIAVHVIRKSICKLTNTCYSCFMLVDMAEMVLFFMTNLQEKNQFMF